MATPGLISPEARQFIIDNCSLTGEELRKDVKEKFGVDVSVQAILEHVKKARRDAEEMTRCADAHIAKNIADRIEKFLPNIINFYEEDLVRLRKIINGEDPQFDMSDSKDPESGRLDKYWQEKYRRLYSDEAEAYLKMRPPITTVRIESHLDPDVSAMDSWTDEQIKKYEAFLKSLEDDQKL